MSSKKSFQKLRTANKMIKENNTKITKPLNRMITPMAQNIEQSNNLKE